jgi:hypothetical protein
MRQLIGHEKPRHLRAGVSRSRPRRFSLVLRFAALALSVSCEQPEEPLPPCGRDLKNDRLNCGRCFHECDREAMCLEGACVADRQLALWPLPAYPLTSDQYEIYESTVVDRTTKLEWQRHVEERIPDEKVLPYCEELELDGKGWRLPTRIELMTIVDFSTRLPAIEKAAFPDTPSSGFKHEDLGDDPRYEWVGEDPETAHYTRVPRGPSQVDFAEGGKWYFPDPNGTAADGTLDDYVRCVRGGTEPASIGKHYDVDEVTVLDLYTGLRWQRNLPQCDDSQSCPSGNALLTIEDAMKYCEALEVGGYDDFRLPGIVELLSVVFRPWSRAIDPELFPEEAKDLEVELWSSTPYARNSDPSKLRVWVLDFSDNIVNAVGAVRARCVRTEVQ